MTQNKVPFHCQLIANKLEITRLTAGGLCSRMLLPRRRSLHSSVRRLVRFLAISVLLYPTIVFAETDTFTCLYTKTADESGLREAEDDFVLRFLIDDQTGKAYLVGNAGSSEVEVITGGGFLSFIEITGVGNIMTTTIVSNGKSVHSRNSVILGDLLASQYYGTCK